MNYSELKNLSLQELRELNSKIVELVKIKKSEVAWETKQELYVGANVSVNHPKLSGKQCRVSKINRTKAVIQVLNSSTSYGRVNEYNVPLTMLTLNK
jgi:vacuolar-type H+-ATPase subunit B/Vma2